jgi:hypothetical protein
MLNAEYKGIVLYAIVNQVMRVTHTEFVKNLAANLMMNVLSVWLASIGNARILAHLNSVASRHFAL